MKSMDSHTCYDIDVNTSCHSTCIRDGTSVSTQWRGGTVPSVETNKLFSSVSVYGVCAGEADSCTVRIEEFSIVRWVTALSVVSHTQQSIISLSNISDHHNVSISVIFSTQHEIHITCNRYDSSYQHNVIFLTLFRGTCCWGWWAHCDWTRSGQFWWRACWGR